MHQVAAVGSINCNRLVSSNNFSCSIMLTYSYLITYLDIPLNMARSIWECLKLQNNEGSAYLIWNKQGMNGHINP